MSSLLAEIAAGLRVALLHELCHHLDYTLLQRSDSFHTDGFYQRESSLPRQLVPPAATATKGVHE